MILIWLLAWMMLWLWRRLDAPRQPMPEREQSGAFYLDDYMDGDSLLPKYQADADEYAYLLFPDDLPCPSGQSLVNIEYDVFERALDELELAAAELVW